MKTLERFIIGLLAMFVLLVTAVAVGGTVRAWGTHDRMRNPPSVSKAEVVSMRPYAGRPPVILVMGPSGSEVEVTDTDELKQPYPSEGDYIDVVFSRSGGAAIPPAGPADGTSVAAILIIAIWLLWCAILVGSVMSGRVLIGIVTGWHRPQDRRPAAARARQSGAVKTGRGMRGSVDQQEGPSARAE